MNEGNDMDASGSLPGIADNTSNTRNSGTASIFNMRSSFQECVEDPVEESAGFVAQRMDELESALRGIPSELKYGYNRAMERCPLLVNTTAHKLMFLRSESFHPELTALRLVRYWNRRLDLFGEDRAFREIGTATDLATLKEDAKALSMGLFRLTHRVDDFGRVILYDDPTKISLLKLGSQRASLMRALWYVMHAALLDCGDLSEQLQRHGLVVLIRRDEFIEGAPSFPGLLTRAMIDRKSFTMVSENMFGVLPIKIGAIHLCRPPNAVARVMIPFIRRSIGPLLKGTIVVHQEGFVGDDFSWGCFCRRRRRHGDRKEMDEALVQELSMYGIPRECLPRELGGDLQLKYDSWLAERREHAEEMHIREQKENDDEKSIT